MPIKNTRLIISFQLLPQSVLLFLRTYKQICLKDCLVYTTKAHGFRQSGVYVKSSKPKYPHITWS